MKLKGRCRDCEYLSLTHNTYKKPWTCKLKNKNKRFEETIFTNNCSLFKLKKNI
jgi:hypothetical protein